VSTVSTPESLRVRRNGAVNLVSRSQIRMRWPRRKALVHESYAPAARPSMPWPGWPSKAHDLGMKSRVHPRFKAKYRVGDWAEYDRALVQRGDITLWISPDATNAWKPAPSGRRGGQRKYSDLAIETALTLRLVFKLPLRQSEGFLRSVLILMDLDLEAPDHTTLSRRSQRLEVELQPVPATKPVHLIVDSTGLSIVGEGEWAAAKHGGKGKRGWKKLVQDYRSYLRRNGTENRGYKRPHRSMCRPPS